MNNLENEHPPLVAHSVIREDALGLYIVGRLGYEIRLDKIIADVARCEWLDTCTDIYQSLFSELMRGGVAFKNSEAWRAWGLENE